MLEITTERCEGTLCRGKSWASLMYPIMVDSMPSFEWSELAVTGGWAAGTDGVMSFYAPLFGRYKLRVYSSQLHIDIYSCIYNNIVDVLYEKNDGSYVSVSPVFKVDEIYRSSDEMRYDMFGRPFSLSITRVGTAFIIRGGLTQIDHSEETPVSAVFVSPFTDAFSDKSGIYVSAMLRGPLVTSGLNLTEFIHLDDDSAAIPASVISTGGDEFPVGLSGELIVAAPAILTNTVNNVYGYAVDNTYLYKIYNNGVLMSAENDLRVTIDGHEFLSVDSVLPYFIRLS